LDALLRLVLKPEKIKKKNKEINKKDSLEEEMNE